MKTPLIAPTVALVFLSMGLAGCQPPNKSHAEASENRIALVADDLGLSRKVFKSRLHVQGPAPQFYREQKAPAGMKEVIYTSGDLKLKGWLSANATEEEKRPAVVFLHGGWALDSADWKDALPFIKAGFVLFMPMLRAENGNPGHHESFLGEVDDAIAAGRYVSSLPYVNDKAVFVAGHSVGGILTSLVAMHQSPYKAAASFDGFLDMASWAAGSPDELIPYDRNNPNEVLIRNPMAFVASLRCPLRLYVGDERQEIGTFFQNKAKRLGKECEMVVVRGDHQEMVAPAVTHSIEWFKQLSAK